PSIRHSQMISVGAAIRWMRFLRLRSGIGQANGVMLLRDDDIMRLEDAPFRETQARTELARSHGAGARLRHTRRQPDRYHPRRGRSDHPRRVVGRRALYRYGALLRRRPGRTLRRGRHARGAAWRMGAVYKKGTPAPASPHAWVG